MSDKFEAFLPPYLNTSIGNMKKSWIPEDSGKHDIHWDLYWCELNADINSAESGDEYARKELSLINDNSFAIC